MKKALFFTFFLFLCGCGYQIQSTKRPLNLSISSIAIPMVKSTSSFLGFEAKLTEMIRQQFISHSGLKIVPQDEADAVLIAEVVDIKTEPISYAVREGSYEVTNSRWLKVKMVAKLVDRRTGKIIWSATFRERAVYNVVAQSPDPLETRYNETQALMTIGKQFSERIYLRTMERF